MTKEEFYLSELRMHCRAMPTKTCHDRDFWVQVGRLFPQSLYKGEAFKAVLCSPDEMNFKLLNRYGYSWSHSIRGVNNFLTNGEWFDPESSGFYLVRADIFGISLKTIFETREEKSFLPIREEEIVLLKNYGTNQVSWTCSNNYIPLAV